MKAIEFIERLALALFAMGLVAFILIRAKLWASDLQVWFFRIGDLQSFAFLSIGIFVFAKILERFLKWEINLLLPHKRRRK